MCSNERTYSIAEYRREGGGQGRGGGGTAAKTT